MTRLVRGVRRGRVAHAAALTALLLVVVASAAVQVPATAAPRAGDATPEPGGTSAPGPEATADFTWQDPELTEGSGLAVSARHDGVLYAVNDSGDSARVFAVDASGATVARLALDGVEAEDVEGLEAGPGDSLWVGDVGDNRRRRDEVVVHRLTEPRTLRDATVPVRSYRLRYPDGAHDAEALLVHPGTGRVYVATKQLLGGVLYAAPARMRPGRVHTLSRVGGVPAAVTGGAFSPDGTRVVLRDPARAHVYRVSGDARSLVADGFTREQAVALPPQPQGESVAWTRDGAALLVGSEGAGSRLWRVPVPADAGSASSTPAVSAPTASPVAEPDAGDGGTVVPAWRWAAGAALAALLVGAGVLLRRRARGAG